MATRFRPDHGLTARMLLTVVLLVVVYAAFVVALVVLLRSVVLVAVVAGGFLLVQFWFSDRIALYAMRATLVTPEQQQDVDSSALTGVPGMLDEAGLVRTGPDFATARPGVFAGGDAVAGERTVTTAIGNGAQAAARIDAYLRGVPLKTPPLPPPATFDLLNTVYYSDAPASVRPRLDLARRVSTFDEIEGGLDADTALFEARRCLSCGTCFECDNCYGMCPDNAITKLGPGLRFTIDYDYCKGCGICVAECPAGAITLEPEES